MVTGVALSMLDFGIRATDESPCETIAQTQRLAVEAEKLGYLRYWLAEHQTVRSAWASPELIIPLLAARTKRIKIGTAGILLRYYNPLKLASDFSLLEHLFPNRIDLGVARGAPGQNAAALLDGLPQGPNLYERKLSDLLTHLSGLRTDNDSHQNVRVIPFPPRMPEVWILGSSLTSMRLASRLGTAFGYSLFHSRNPDPTIVEEYVSTFQESPWLREPKVIVAFAGVCADTDDNAQRILKANQNETIFPTVVGSPETCRASIVEIAQTYGCLEFVFHDISRSIDDRIRSCQLLMVANSF